jgi:predicted DNA binding CopG/RHH family protein
METADSNSASVLQGKLAELSQRFQQLQLQQQEKESNLKKLLPQAEMFEQLSNKLQQFMENKSRLLASGNQPDQDIAHFSQQIQVRIHACHLSRIKGRARRKLVFTEHIQCWECWNLYLHYLRTMTPSL